MTETTAMRPRSGWGVTAESVRGLIGTILLLAFVGAIALWLAVPLYQQEMWLPLGVLIFSTVLIFALYLQPFHIPI
jgi:uncharacterized membrane protein YccC